MFYTAYEVHDGEEMFEPVFTNDGRGEALALEDVRSEVASVQQEFDDCLKDEDMGREELECVSLMLRACAGGPGNDALQVARESAELLDKVQEKLKTAAADLQRFDEESLAGAALSTGKRVHRLTRAATAVARARQRLEQVSKH